MSKTETSASKTNVELSQVERFVRENLDSSLVSAVNLSGGEVSQAFELINDTCQTVIRLGPREDLFQKDKLAAERYAGEDLHIPKVFRIGNFKHGLFYCWSEKANGINGDQLGKDEKKAALPAIFKTLGIIHNKKIPNTSIYGNWSEGYEPDFDSYHAYLSERLKQEFPEGSTNEEKALIERYYTKFSNGINFTYPKAHLLHSDFTYDNFFIEDNQVSGVIDWAGSCYGDPLFDLAYIQFWYAHIDVVQLYTSQNGSGIKNEKDFDGRFENYIIYTGLRSLSFFERSRQKKAYDWTLDRLKILVQHGIQP